MIDVLGRLLSHSLLPELAVPALYADLRARLLVRERCALSRDAGSGGSDAFRYRVSSSFGSLWSRLAAAGSRRTAGSTRPTPRQAGGTPTKLAFCGQRGCLAPTAAQSEHPDARIIVGRSAEAALSRSYATRGPGIDDQRLPRFGRTVLGISTSRRGWGLAGAVADAQRRTAASSSRLGMGSGPARGSRKLGVRLHPAGSAWGSTGSLSSQMGDLPVTLYTGRTSTRTSP